MIGRVILVLTLDDGAAISSNFVRVTLPAGLPQNEWMQVLVTGLDEDGVRAATAVE
jgi:hypothetical protein